MALTDAKFDEIMAAAFPGFSTSKGTMDGALEQALPGLSEGMRLKVLTWVLAAVQTEDTGNDDVRMLLAFAMGARIGGLVERAEG